MANLKAFIESIPSCAGLGSTDKVQDIVACEPISVPDDGGKVPKEGSTPEDEKGARAEVKKVACSRCKSLDTKFCYFNNCNVNQPRHYCRSCERYWTAGGTLRNTPMGSGRRKRKHSSVLPTAAISRHLKKPSSQNFSHLSISNSPKSGAFPVSQDSTAVPVRDGIQLQAQKVLNGTIPTVSGSQATNSHSKLSCTASNERQACETTEASKQAAGFMGSSPFSFPIGPWPYGYGLFGWNNEAISSIPHIGDRNFATPFLNTWGLPWPLMPFPPWNIPPWSPTNGAGAMAEHCSEGLQTVAGTNECLFTPKTLRVHDPEEAAQSSIWSALGLDNRFDLSVSDAGIFNGSPLKVDHVAETEECPLQALHANPAATSRSMTYHDNN